MKGTTPNTAIPNKTTLNTIVVKEMGYSQQEFLNQFATFASDLDYKLTNNRIIITEQNSSIIIALTEKQGRSLGSLIIPSLSIQFEFKNCSSEQQKKFLEKFDFSFRRGGG